MLGSTIRPAGVLGLVLACLLPASAALADPGNGNGNGPPGGVPPGQAKQAEVFPPAAAPAQPAQSAQPASPPGKSATAPGQVKKASGAPPRRASNPTPASTPRSRPASPGKSAEAQHHVILCHRTGSETNPWTVINISVRGWTNGHQGAHGDIVLKDPARPGEKLSESLCPGATVTAATSLDRGRDNGQTKVTICHATGSATNPFVVITIAQAGWLNGHSKHEGDRLLGTGRIEADASACAPRTAAAAGAIQPLPASGAAPAQPQPAAVAGLAGVAGPLEPEGSQPAGGVLGAAGELGRAATRATLPFTGLPLWLAVFVGGALLAAGLGVRLITTK